MPKSKRKNAKEEDENSAQHDSLPDKMPPRKLRAVGFAETKLELDKLDDSRKKILTECAILAMQDHAFRLVDYRDGLRFIKLLEAVASKDAGYMYTISFVGVCDVYGQTTFKAVVYDGMVHREVIRVWTVASSQDEDPTGRLCIPLISITEDIALSSDRILATNDEEKLLLGDTTESSSIEDILRDCAILAMQDHAIQNDYFDGLRLTELLNLRISFAYGHIFSITFRGASDKYDEATYQADVWGCVNFTRVVRVRTISPPSEWCTGMLFVPKIACKE